MELTTILVLISILVLIIASFFDIKTREVPDWVSYSLIIIGVSFSLINSLLKDNFALLLYPIGGFILAFIIANLMYYSRQWGGVDAKLLMGLGITFSIYPESLLNFFRPNLEIFPFFAILLINLMIIGAVYGILWSIFLFIKNFDKVRDVFKANLKKNRKIRYFITIFAMVMLMISFFLGHELRFFIAMIGASFFLFFYLMLFIRSVEDSSMFRNIPVEKLTAGDWVVGDITIDKKIVYKQKNTGITKEDIEILKKLSTRISGVIVKEGIPFIPSFLIAAIISLMFGNIIMMFF